MTMDFEQAVEDWKAHDQWEFADKQAAWGFFFMAGRESKQRENEMDPHIDGVVPVQMTDAERGFLNGMLIGNLRRIYAAHDDEGNDLSALPSRAADEIERMQGHVADEYEEAMQELDKYGIPRADGDGPIFTLRGRMLRFLVRMTSNALGQEPCAAICARSPAPMS
jgi:hypothetical protein